MYTSFFVKFINFVRAHAYDIVNDRRKVNVGTKKI